MDESDVAVGWWWLEMVGAHATVGAAGAPIHEMCREGQSQKYGARNELRSRRRNLVILVLAVTRGLSSAQLLTRAPAR
jgi:hypothetical protein